MYYDLK